MEKELEQDKRKRHSLLSQYYGMSEEKEMGNPYDINGKSFNPDMYLQKVIKESSLKQLMDKEKEVVREIQTLDSDMQTLVYENYNKFILATDTIRKMKDDFKEMENEMDKLVKNMDDITKFSSAISETLHDKRAKIAQLSSAHSMLKKLQFLFDLPTEMKRHIHEDNPAQAVKMFSRAQRLLEDNKNLPAFQGLYTDCQAIVESLRQQLLSQLKTGDAPPPVAVSTIKHLMLLGFSPSNLSNEVLEQANNKLNQELNVLEKLSTPPAADSSSAEPPMDLLEFVDLCVNGLLQHVYLYASTFKDFFAAGDNSTEAYPWTTLCQSSVERGLQYLLKKIVWSGAGGEDCTLLVRALDRWQKKLSELDIVLPPSLIHKWNTELVSQAGASHVKQLLKHLTEAWNNAISSIRQVLVTNENVQLPPLVSSLLGTVVESVKSSLASIQMFLEGIDMFSTNHKLRLSFSRQVVREELLVQYVHAIVNSSKQLEDLYLDHDSKPPLTLLLILTKAGTDLANSTWPSLLALAEEQLSIREDRQSTSLLQMQHDLRQAAQGLIELFVKQQSASTALILRKSVDSRDWMQQIETRSVRPVAKRVIDEITDIDAQVGTLFEEGLKKDRGSDSSRRTYFTVPRHPPRSNWSYTPSQDASLLNNLHRLFSEKLDLTSPVDCNRLAIVSAVVKLSLKTLLECVRLKTFSKHGLQQMQVDCHYLQLFLWKFVSDENMVQGLLDEVMSSAMHRSTDPTLMEPSLLESICDRA